MNKRNFRRVCIPCSTYVLTFYLLMSSKKEIDETFFFFAHSIPQSVRQKFTNSYYIDLKDNWHKNKYILSLYTWIKRKAKWSFIEKADIYGLDFYWDLLRGLKMNYIEDAPCVFDIWESTRMYEVYQEFNTYSPLKKFLKRALFGSYYQHPVGTSRLTQNLYATSFYDKPYHKGKKCIVKNLKEEWEKSDHEKKQYILDIFDVTADDLQKLKSRDTILLTQAFAEDRKMTENEQIEMYRDIINHYGDEHVIIKPHPRDKIDYRKVFPDVLLFDKKIPMQMLSILDVTFQCVATVNSSSALSYGADTHIDWWGDRMNPTILKDEGFLTLEEAKQSLRKQR